MRYIIIDSEIYEGQRYRLIYDTVRKHFAVVQKLVGKLWKNERFVDQNFYIYYPGHAKNVRTSNKLPNWK